eukprot:5958446-Prymnesium_polylepis.1
MQISATAFTSNTYGAAAAEETGTQVQSFKIKQSTAGSKAGAGGRRRLSELHEKKVANLATPIVMRFPLLLQPAPSLPWSWLCNSPPPVAPPSLPPAYPPVSPGDPDDQWRPPPITPPRPPP